MNVSRRLPDAIIATFSSHPSQLHFMFKPVSLQKWLRGLEAYKEKPKLKEDVVRIFNHHVFNYMPIHLLLIDPLGVDRVHFKLIERKDLKPEDYVSEDAIVSFSAQEKLPREEAIRKFVSQQLQYAIFSHRWSEHEASFDEVQKAGLTGLGADPPQWYGKLEHFCAEAAKHGCRLAWADTACIDKGRSAELEQAIRSMFNWYHNSFVCIIYLSESSGMDDFENDHWFTRGWTLQELLAPARVKFYTRHWTPIKTINDCPNDKDDDNIMHAVSRTTDINIRDLRQFSPGLLNVREKMMWASRRTTMLEEDIAYCLLGIFDISIPITYGEGKRAFHRLMEAIIQSCREWQIFAWAGHHSPYAIALPESPCCYGSDFLGQVRGPTLDPARPIHRPWDHGYPFYTLTKRGLEIKVLLVEMMLQIHRDADSGPYERLVLRPAPHDQRYFHDVIAICDTRFLLYSRWAVGIISYQTDGDGNGQHHENRDEIKGELGANEHFVCFLLGTGIYSPYGKWEKVGTRKVLTIGTKEVVRKELMTLWL